MQQFLLELGKGFLFEARQKRFTFDEDNYYVDLVFYNRLLQCYVLIDLKTDKLTHQDLGQMQMYVNYYDRFVKQDFEKPTIGILLCASHVRRLEKYPRGRRGSPAKGVVRVNRSQGSNPCFSAKQIKHSGTFF